MADENLVSTVYFRGTNMGTSTIQIIDTSVPPNYTVTYLNEGHATNDPTKPMALRPGKPQVVELQQSPVNNDITKVYVKLSGTDAGRYILSNVFNQVNTGGVVKGEVTITPSGYGKLNAHLNFWPAGVELNAVVEFFHDAAMTQKFLTVPLQTQPSTDAFLTITTDRENPSITAGVYNNDSLIIMFRDSLSRAIKYTTSLPFKLFIDDEEIVNGNYPDTGGHYFRGNVDLLLKNYGQGNAGYCKLDRQRNLAKPGNKTIRVQIGVRSETVPLLDIDGGNLIGQTYFATGSGAYTPVDRFPPGITNGYQSKMACGFGFIKQRPVGPANPGPGNPPNPPFETARDYCNGMVIRRNQPDADKIMIRTDGWELSHLNAAFTRSTREHSEGNSICLLWNPDMLTTASSRAQFGKYQKTLRRVYEYTGNTDPNNYLFRPFAGDSYNGNPSGDPWLGEAGGGFNIPDLNYMQDPVATAQFGALTSLDPTKLACFVFPNRDETLQYWDYQASPMVNWNGGRIGIGLTFDGAQPVRPALPPARVSITNRTHNHIWLDALFLRTNGRNEKNTFDASVPYPRIVNVQTARGYRAYGQSQCFWDFEVDPSLGIDLTDGKYLFLTTVQSTSTWGVELWSLTSVTVVGRSPHKITFRSSDNNLDPHLCLAIVQTQAVDIPANKPTGLIHAVNPLNVAPTLSRFTAANNEYTPGGYIQAPRITMNGWIMDLISLDASVFVSNPNLPWDGLAGVTFFTYNNLEDTRTSKPATIWVWLEGDNNPIELRRGNKNFPDLTPPITASSQTYSSYSDADMVRLHRWLQGTNTAPKTARFSLSNIG